MKIKYAKKKEGDEENKCQEVQDKVVRQNILLIFNKDSNKVYSQIVSKFWDIIF